MGVAVRGCVRQTDVKSDNHLVPAHDGGSWVEWEERGH